MITTIAWRNIWRSRTRSWVIIGAIMLGIWALVFMISFTTGMVQSYVDNSIKNGIGHLQVHKADYREEAKLEYYFQPSPGQLARLTADPDIVGVAPRTLVQGMIASSRNTCGVQVKGVDPEVERSMTPIADQITEGAFLSDEGRNPIVLGQALADKLNIRLRSKVVVTFQDVNGEITAGAFRVVGIFDTGNKLVDEGKRYGPPE